MSEAHALAQAAVDGTLALDEVARRLFAHQLSACPDYARFCARRGVHAVTSWREIPLMPVAGFRELYLYAYPERPPVAVFETSGTTNTRTGRHAFASLDAYRYGALRAFSAAFLPHGGRRRIVSLVPKRDSSSLARMCRWVIDAFGDAESRVDPTGQALLHVDVPPLILGTAFGLAAFFETHPTLRLPPGTAIMETGGFKGRHTERSRQSLHNLYRRAEIPSRQVVGEYGMTELSSQWYDGQVGLASAEPEHRIYLPPPWARTRVLDPVTLQEVSEGQTGLLAHFDPVNVASVLSILTADLGERRGGGFIYRGRAEGALVRGCSLLDEAPL